jgi:acetylornithine aminotransferase/acetylornithine/N-succinyldiaminopimelate aminotransferase
MTTLLPTYGERPLQIERGQGCLVFDAADRPYLDFITGIGVNALGYGHPRILEELRGQAGLCIHTSNLHRHRYQEALAAKLAEWSGLDRVFLSNSGSEAMEAALKAARARANKNGRGRHRIVALENGFHGRTAGALAVTAKPQYREPFLPLVPDVVFVPPNDIGALENAVTGDTIAVVAETIQGEGGIFPLSQPFLAAIRSLATKRDALWIADETQCGLGRTGERFAWQRYEGAGRPDIVVTAKPLGGGLPLGATMFTESACEAIGQGMHGTTFGGGPLACRVAIAFLEEVEQLLPAIRQNGAYLQAQLRYVLTELPVVREVRGRGMMAGIELTVNGEPYVRHALAAGLVINCTHGNVLRLLPPFIAGRAEIDRACSILRQILMPTSPSRIF